MRKHRRAAALTNYKAKNVPKDGDGDLGHELWSLRVREIYVVVFERTHSPVTFNPV